MLLRCLPLAWILTALATPYTHAQEAFFVPLPGSVRAVSGDGRVVAGMADEAYIWTQDLGVVTLGFAGTPWAVSQDGSVIVGSTSEEGPLNDEAFRWQEGELQRIAVGSAQGVSDDGTVVVGALGEGATVTQAFRWDASTGLSPLGHLPGNTPPLASFSRDVTPDGRVVVGNSRGADGDRAFRWTAETGMVPLGAVPQGYTGVAAGSVSADGYVAVGRLDIAPGDTEAARWTQATGWVSLGDAGTLGIARGVSSDGSIVIGQSGGAFIWDAAHGMRNLADVLRADYGLGDALAGWNLGIAWDLSDDGRTIVGDGTGPNGFGYWVAHLGTPVPEPSTWALALAASAGSLLIFRSRRRQYRML